MCFICFACFDWFLFLNLFIFLFEKAFIFVSPSSQTKEKTVSLLFERASNRLHHFCNNNFRILLCFIFGQNEHKNVKISQISNIFILSNQIFWSNIISQARHFCKWSRFAQAISPKCIRLVFCTSGLAWHYQDYSNMEHNIVYKNKNRLFVDKLI